MEIAAIIIALCGLTTQMCSLAIQIKQYRSDHPPKVGKHRK